MKTLAIFVLALFAVVMSQDKVNVVDNNGPLLQNPDSFFSQPSAPNPPQQPGSGYVRPSVGPAYVNQGQGGDYRKDWEANHNVSPNARGGK